MCVRACVRVGVWAIGACPRGDGARVAWVPPYGYERITAVPNNKIARVNLQKKNCHDFWPRMHFFRLFGLEPAAVTLNQIVLVSNTSPCHTHIHMRAPTGVPLRAAAAARSLRARSLRARSLHIQPLSDKSFGCTVSGLDLSSPPSTENLALLKDALTTYGNHAIEPSVSARVAEHGHRACLDFGSG